MLFNYFAAAGKPVYYPTFDELEQYCSVCQKIASFNPNQMQTNQSCKNNKMCDFINDVVNGMKKMPLPEQRTKYCEDHQYCHKPLPVNLNGNRCPTCNQLAIHLLGYSGSQRPEALHRFCSTPKSIGVSLCGDIQENGEAEFLDQLKQLNDPIATCLATHFCRRPNEGSSSGKTQKKVRVAKSKDENL